MARKRGPVGGIFYGIVGLKGLGVAERDGKTIASHWKEGGIQTRLEYETSGEGERLSVADSERCMVLTYKYHESERGTSRIAVSLVDLRSGIMRVACSLPPIREQIDYFGTQDGDLERITQYVEGLLMLSNVPQSVMPDSEQLERVPHVVQRCRGEGRTH